MSGFPREPLKVYLSIFECSGNERKATTTRKQAFTVPKKERNKKNQQFSRGNTNKPKSVSAKKAHQDILRDFESIAWLVNIETLLANTHNLVVKDV